MSTGLATPPTLPGDAIRTSAPQPNIPGRDNRALWRTVRYGLLILFVLVMLMPLVMSVLASLKPTAEAAATPPTYLPHGFSFESYQRLWNYQQGLPTYLANSFGTAVLTIVIGRPRPGGDDRARRASRRTAPSGSSTRGRSPLSPGKA